MNIADWDGLQSKLGQNITQCDGAVFWNDSTTKGLRTSFTRLRIGVCNLQSLRYSVSELDPNLIAEMLNSSGLDQRSQAIALVECAAIKVAYELFPSSLIESDSKQAIAATIALLPSARIVWRPRRMTSLAHRLAHSAPVGSGVAQIGLPGRGWLKLTAD